MFALVLVLAAATIAQAAMSNKLNDEASRLSDDAFALLSSVNADVSGGTTPPLLTPVATLAGDAQKLASAVSADDLGRASRAMAAVRDDIAAVEAAHKGGSGGFDTNRLSSIKARYAALVAAIPPDAAAAVKGSDEAAAPSPPASSKPAASADSPRVVVDSRRLNGSRIRVTGSVQGTDLKSAGVYDGESEVTSFDVAHTTARQRINFDVTLEDAGRGRVIRVVDNLGRSAQAPVAGSSIATTERTAHGNDKMIEVDGGGVATSPPRPPVREGGVNTAEIPRADTGDDEPEPPRGSRGATVGAPRNVQVTILGVTQSLISPGSIEVIGQINGEGIRRAGIYVDGRLARRIPLASDRLSAFDETFPMIGRTATVRVYGSGESFVESSIQIPDDYDMALRRTPPIVVAPGYNTYGSPYGPGVNPYGPGANPYPPPGPNPYPYNPYTNPYGSNRQPYPPGYGPPPQYGYPQQYPPGRAPKPWWKKLLP
ncbi:MAG: hypothetical protein ACREQF_05905 [Candidatus Binataceae bacterium]